MQTPSERAKLNPEFILQNLLDYLHEIKGLLKVTVHVMSCTVLNQIISKRKLSIM